MSSCLYEQIPVVCVVWRSVKIIKLLLVFVVQARAGQDCGRNHTREHSGAERGSWLADWLAGHSGHTHLPTKQQTSCRPTSLQSRHSQARDYIRTDINVWGSHEGSQMPRVQIYRTLVKNRFSPRWKKAKYWKFLFPPKQATLLVFTSPFWASNTQNTLIPGLAFILYDWPTG